MAARKTARHRVRTAHSRVVSPKQRPARSPARRAVAVGAALRLPRVPKGKRARFFDEAGVDQLFGIVTALAAELSAASERIETLERVLERRGALRRVDLAAHAPDADEMAERARAREALIERVFQVLEAYSGL